MKHRIALAQLESEILRIDPKQRRENLEFKAAVILLASAYVGPHEGTIANITGYGRDTVEVVGENLRKSGIWSGRKINADWCDPETGGAEFWLDVACAAGVMERM